MRWECSKSCSGKMLLKMFSAERLFSLRKGHLRNKDTLGYLVSWWQHGEAVWGFTGSYKWFNPSKTRAWQVSTNQVTTCACKPCYWLSMKRWASSTILSVFCFGFITDIIDMILALDTSTLNLRWNTAMRLTCQLSALIWGCASLKVVIQFIDMLRQIKVRWLTWQINLQMSGP